MSKITEKILKQLYIEEKKTDAEIAIILGCKSYSVYRSRKKFGIKAYKRWERNICNPSERQIEIIYASLMGDGSISNGIKNGKPCESLFEEKHCKDQKQYMFWKYRELQNLCVSPPKQTNKKKQWRIRTFHHPFFSELRKKFYPNNIKIINKEILEKINELGLAVWYMDDGTICKQGNHVKFCTCSFTEEEHEILKQWMKDRFSIKTFMKTYDGYNFLVVDLVSRKDLFGLLKKNVIESMKYKITFREFHTWKNI